MVTTVIDPFASGCVLSPEQGGTGVSGGLGTMAAQNADSVVLTGPAKGTTFTLTDGLIQRQSAYPITLALGDAGALISAFDAAAGVINIPAHGTVPFDTGAIIVITQAGAGQATFTPAGGVTLNNVDGHTKTKGQFAYTTLRYRGGGVWDLFGATA